MESDYIIKTDCMYYPIVPKNGTDYTLEELREIVGGNIEIVDIDADSIMVLNEEGKIRGLQVNELATSVYHIYRNINDYIVGDVLWCQKERVK